MKHRSSAADESFRQSFEALRVTPEEFDHAAHVRLAYVYLCEDTIPVAVEKMRRALLAFLDHLGVGEAKYHQTMTQAWVMAVDHFMDKTAACASADELLQRNPQLRDSKIMLTHYSADLLFSPGARRAFVAPDIQAIPPP